MHTHHINRPAFEGRLVNEYVMYAGAVKRSAPPPPPPRCIRCARPMQLIRKTRRFGGLPDLYTFQCSACGELHVEEGGACPLDIGVIGAPLVPLTQVRTLFSGRCTEEFGRGSASRLIAIGAFRLDRSPICLTSRDVVYGRRSRRPPIGAETTVGVPPPANGDLVKLVAGFSNPLRRRSSYQRETRW